MLRTASFMQRYQKWCRHHVYNYQPDKAKTIYNISSDLITILPKNAMNKMLVMQGIDQLNAVSAIIIQLKAEMNTLASEIPEYPVVMAMPEVGPCLGPQIMAEIGDISQSPYKSTLMAFAEVDPRANQSGDYEAKNNHTSKAWFPAAPQGTFYGHGLPDSNLTTR